jgi:pimeloyl-ACP methyl ester carboxylesterase
MINQGFVKQLQSTSPDKLRAQSIGNQITAARRVGRSPAVSSTARLQLFASQPDLLDWGDATAIVPGISGRRRGQSQSLEGEIELIEFPRLPPSEITKMLGEQDDNFTPRRGLRRLNRSMQLETASFPDSGNVLLFIHGTISNGDNNIAGILNSADTAATSNPGKAFLIDAMKKYSAVYVFDHPTLSVSPIVNALALQQAIRKSKAKIDIICHSRGGLVTRWWCETFDPELDRCKRAILLGSPLAGTGLASPPNIRKTLQLITNYANGLTLVTGASCVLTPIFGLMHVLLRIFTSVTWVAASTPIADSLMAMAPGLFGQSRVGNNPELLMLHELPCVAERYSAVIANFESSNVGWRFWKYFNKERIIDGSTDFLFDGANDLVVDTESMQHLGDKLAIPMKQTLDFGTTNKVHHLNYFSQPETIDFFRKTLDL